MYWLLILELFAIATYRPPHIAATYRGNDLPLRSIAVFWNFSIFRYLASAVGDEVSFAVECVRFGDCCNVTVLRRPYIKLPLQHYDKTVAAVCRVTTHLENLENME